MRIQETVAKGKQWKKLGTITEQTEGKDSFMIELDDSEVIRCHKRFIREERGEEFDNQQEAEESADRAEDCTKRAEPADDWEPTCDRVLRSRPVQDRGAKNNEVPR